MKTNKMLFTVLMLVLLAGMASALQVGSAKIGDDNQDRVENVSATFQITNNGSVTLDNITVSTTADPKYNLQFTNKPTSLAPGAAQTVTVTGKIPLDFDAVDTTTLEEKAFKIGDITVQGYEATVLVSETADLNMQAVNQIELKKIKVSCDSNEENLDDGEKMKELKPDMQDCQFYIKIENDFNENDKNDQKIGDIEIDTTIEVESDDSDVDLDDSDEVNLDADEYEEITFDFDIDEEADDGSYEITVKVFGTDENNAFHGEKWTVELEVERLKHDLTFDKVSVNPSELETCDVNGAVNVAVTIYNMGRRDEDEAAVELKLPDFKYSKKIEDIEIDRSDKTTVNFDVLLPVNVKEGLYRGTLKSYFDTLAESHSETVQIKVTKCTTEEPEETEEDNQTTIVIPQQTQQQIPPTITKAQTTTPTTQTKDSFTESTAYLGLLTAFVVLLLIAIVIIGVVFFVKKK